VKQPTPDPTIGNPASRVYEKMNYVAVYSLNNFVRLQIIKIEMKKWDQIWR
jgi:hypothetical protein